jgi:hypothetical protein
MAGTALPRAILLSSPFRLLWNSPRRRHEAAGDGVLLRIQRWMADDSLSLRVPLKSSRYQPLLVRYLAISVIGR